MSPRPRAVLCQTARVFGHDRRSEDVARRIDHLMEAVLVADGHDRVTRIAEHVAPDFVYVSPEAVFDGAEGLSEAFARFRHDAWRDTRLRRTSPVEMHHGYFRYSWARVERGATTVEGWSFGSVDESGAIDRVVVFEGLVPGAGDGPG
jgi:hypothetical protein